MQISEIFHSLQGEGRLAGVPSTFIRLAGCPLRCRWCDTPYAWSPTSGSEFTIDQVIGQTKQYPCEHVVVTGGEPLACPDLPELLKALRSISTHITIETAGLSHIANLPCDLMSISPKLSNSAPTDMKTRCQHEKQRLNIPALTELIKEYHHQLKFVIENETDLEEVQAHLAQLPPIPKTDILLMPQATTRDEYIQRSPLVAELCKQAGYAFSPRLQTIIWDNKRRK